MFAKIFSQIFDSSIAEDWQVRCVFEDLLLLCNSDGEVDMTLEAVSRRTNVPIEIVGRAIQELLKPDPNSRTKEQDGRRIIPLDKQRSWGWKIVNYIKYREIRSELDRSRASTTNGKHHYGGYVYFATLADDESKVKIGYSRNPWARVRELSTGTPNGVCFLGCISGGPDTELEWHERFKDLRKHGEWFEMTPELKSAIDSVVDTSLREVITRSYCSDRNAVQKKRQRQKQKKVPLKSPEGDVDVALTIYSAYPRKVGKPSALRAINRVIRDGFDPNTLLGLTASYAHAVKGTGTILPHPATWFNDRRFEDDPSTWVRQQLNGESKRDLEKTLERKQSRMKDLKCRHFSDVGTMSGLKWIEAGWRDLRAREEHDRLKTECQQLTERISKIE